MLNTKASNISFSLKIVENEIPIHFYNQKTKWRMEKLRDTPTFGRLFREIKEVTTRRGMEKGMARGMA
ncbi:hypothetical protein GCM10011346_31010 [Oceanobacillus neutriphilus]|uniref:Uncharacterized protein n=1 Tax=Oceanobacillus neutriphilus TaxID=531815 RepID=A0ABQ2NXG0_9BACI|nr:hypothetical protein GCM10011346_31010 [Oceanobacillus neutriphilus]